MAELPSTKQKQREHVSKLRGAAFNLYVEEKASKREPSVHLRLLREGLDLLYEQMFNRRALQRGRVTADSVTATKIAEVWALRAAHPDLAQKEIAYRLNIDVGRVSEILHGKRT